MAYYHIWHTSIYSILPYLTCYHTTTYFHIWHTTIFGILPYLATTIFGYYCAIIYFHIWHATIFGILPYYHILPYMVYYHIWYITNFLLSSPTTSTSPLTSKPASFSDSGSTHSTIPPPFSPRPSPMKQHGMRTRRFFNEDYSYIMDAKGRGNLGRYINVSPHYIMVRSLASNNGLLDIDPKSCVS